MVSSEKTPMPWLVIWARAKSLLILPFGECACTVEPTASLAAPSDLERWGARVFSDVPEQADLLLIGGRISKKMPPVPQQTFERMLQPKWVVALGGCGCAAFDAPGQPPVQACGFYDTYSQARDVGRFVQADPDAPGCPPGIEDLIDTNDDLQCKIRHKG